MRSYSKYYVLSVGLLSVMASGCSDSPPMVSLGLDEVYYTFRMQKLILEPAFEGTAYRWYGADGQLLSTARDYIFLEAVPGTYSLMLVIENDEEPFSFEFQVNVLPEEIAYSPYISRVLEYCPAPGQFVNTMPEYESGDTYEDMLRKVNDALSGTNDELVTLGGYGGYVTFGFDHTVVNRPDDADFRLWGNCFYERTPDGRPGGSAEPGIVMVSLDCNGNGLADDEWYELKGSAYSDPATIHNYSITYHRPNPDREIVQEGALADKYYIAWNDSQGISSYMPMNLLHLQDYFPAWLSSQTLTFSGSRLADNAVDLYGNGLFYMLYCYDWGYADNHPNDESALNSFDISDAVDRDGMPVNLPGADFIRVYTAVNQYCGRIGETSTEICRAQDLNIDEN